MSQDIHQERILVLDFGSQYTQLIARRVRELGVFCEILPFDVPEAEIRHSCAPGRHPLRGAGKRDLGGNAAGAKLVFELGVPVLGICYGMQTMALQLGGAVEPSDEREFGHARVTRLAADAFLGDPVDHGDTDYDVWMSHGDRVSRCPRAFSTVGNRPTRPLPPWPTRRAISTACSSIPRSPTPSKGRPCSAGSCGRSAAAMRSGPRPILSTMPSTAVREQVGGRQGAARPVRGRRFLRGGRPAPPRHR
jgi:GMP synthase (glutamine-hydrolysing) A subunit